MKRTRHSSSALLGAILLGLLSACSDDPVTLEPSLSHVSRDTVRVSVATQPGVAVSLCRDCERVVADAAGRAELSIPVPASPSDYNAFRLGPATIVAYRETLFGLGDDERAAEADISLPFDVLFLRQLPEDPSGSWLRVLGTSNMTTTTQGCVAIGEGDIGSGQIDPEGGAFAGAPGTQVKLGDVEFTLDDVGLHSWVPSAAELAGLFDASLDEVVRAVVVEAPGEQAVSSEATLTLLPMCRERMAEAFIAAAGERSPWPAPATERAAFTLVGRLDGDLYAVGSGSEGAAIGSATYLAVEEEVSRAEDQVECQIAAAYAVEVNSGRQVGARRGKPIRVTTRVSLLRAEGFELLRSEEFSPGDACEDTVFPARDAITTWIREQTPAE